MPFVNKIAATSLFILISNLAVLLLRFSSTTSYYTTSLSMKGCSQTKQVSLPLWIQLLLLADYAIEFPLIYAFHPVTLSDTALPIACFPSIPQFLMQILVFGLAETIFYTFALWVTQAVDDNQNDVSSSPVFDTLHSPIAHEIPVSKTTTEVSETGEEDDGVADTLVMTFLSPRGALIIGVALLGSWSPLASATGAAHPLAMGTWVFLRQLRISG